MSGTEIRNKERDHDIRQEIAENDYDFSINKYKQVGYVPVEYPPTSEILANIRKIEAEIAKEMDELERMPE